MRYFAMIAVCGFSIGCGREVPVTPKERLKGATEALVKAKSDQEKFYALNEAAKQSFDLGNFDDAKKYADELLVLSVKFPKDWNFGNAVHDGNVVLGRIAVKDGRVEDAKRYLLEAGKTPGSPQLGSFGPNVTLAKDLLDKGERDVVVEYFGLCRGFWKMDNGRLDQWSKNVKDGKTPDFGPNLAY